MLMRPGRCEAEMFEFLWLIPALPLAGFLLLAISGHWLNRTAVGVIGVGSTALSAIGAAAISITFILNPPADGAFRQILATWIAAGSFAQEFALHLDSLSVVMTLVVTGVGFFILLYSYEFMAEDTGFARFFAYMDLFVGSMLILVLADNLLFLFMGWEGVGLCSYLLIGFWYKDPANVRAGNKAFLVTRIGDAGLIFGLALLFSSLGTLEIQDVMSRASEQWAVGSPIAVAAALLLLSGAVGKSAQLPLQTWLPDAMAGPTPVSALIHAATMVAAGVYLIARMNGLFILAPQVMTVVAVVGAATLFVAAFSALTQFDIKKVLVYSTMSQIGYMFMALGVGAWSAAIFHFVTHAFFKSLLFLGAGMILHCASDERNMLKLGGLRSSLPVTFWTFLVGAASLSAVPIVTGGFYSKDMILDNVWFSPIGSKWFWLVGLVGALMTSLYTFRMVILTFFGEAKTRLEKKPGNIMTICVIILAIGAVVTGFLGVPQTLGGREIISEFLQSVLQNITGGEKRIALQGGLEFLSAIFSLSGILIAFLVYKLWPKISNEVVENTFGSALHQFWLSGWGFDYLYQVMIVNPFIKFAELDKGDIINILYEMLLARPYLAIARLSQGDIINSFYLAIAWLNRQAHMLLVQTQTGRLRHYAYGLAFGVILAITIVILK